MDPAKWAEIRRLVLRECWSKRRIGRHLRIDRKTIEKALAMDVYEPTHRTAERASKLDAHREFITAWLERHPDLSVVRLRRELRTLGYSGGISILRDLVRELRPKTSPEVFAKLAFPPGDAAQVDWATCGKLLVDGRQRRLSVFVLVLCHSRYLYAQFTLQERMEVFLSCHEAAFEALGGVPRRSLYDNLRSVVLARAGDEIRLHPRFSDFAAHYGFQPVPCAPYRPNEKGRVENAIRYLKRNFLAGRSFADLDTANKELRRWLDEIANVRLHAVTRRRPVDLLVEERPLLWPLPQGRYDTRVIRAVKANTLCRVHFDGNTYSVPPSHVGASLVLKASSGEVAIYRGTDEIGRHPRAQGKHEDVVDPKHLRVLISHKRRADRGVVVQRFLALGAAAEPYLKGLVHAEVALHRHLRRILLLADFHGRALVLSAIEHALPHKAFGADYVEHIVRDERRRLGAPRPLGPVSIAKAPELSAIHLEDVDLEVYDQVLLADRQQHEQDTIDPGPPAGGPEETGPVPDPRDP
jgi:transposase